MTEATEQTGGVLRITLVRSTIGRPKDQGATVRSLGLRKLHQTVEHPDNPSVRGMVTKVRHLVKVDEIAAADPRSSARETGQHDATEA